VGKLSVGTAAAPAPRWELVLLVAVITAVVGGGVLWLVGLVAGVADALWAAVDKQGRYALRHVVPTAENTPSRRKHRRPGQVSTGWAPCSRSQVARVSRRVSRLVAVSRGVP